MQDVLLAAGVPEIWSEYCVNFASANEPSEGPYETCLSPPPAMNRGNDVILAQFMNDESLWPDHDAPVRMIPGYVGGQCVEWLQEIWVSDKENDGRYLIGDNGVLHRFVTEWGWGGYEYDVCSSKHRV